MPVPPTVDEFYEELGTSLLEQSIVQSDLSAEEVAQISSEERRDLGREWCSDHPEVLAHYTAILGAPNMPIYLRMLVGDDNMWPDDREKYVQLLKKVMEND